MRVALRSTVLQVTSPTHGIELTREPGGTRVVAELDGRPKVSTINNHQQTNKKKPVSHCFFFFLFFGLVWLGQLLDRDFELRITTAEPHAPRLLIETAVEGDTACCLALVPTVRGKGKK